MICVRLMSVSYCCVVFFFKHKTAYEMRISDWSSDVCSSDLICREITNDMGAADFSAAPEYRQQPCRSGRKSLLRLGDHGSKCAAFVHRQIGHGLSEIGRASCRERVCPKV